MKYNKTKHNRFVSEYHNFIVVLDVLMVLVVLINIGASFITNILVVKKVFIKEVQFKEINPVTAKLYDYEQHSSSNLLFKKIIFQFALYGVMIFLYMYYRLTIDGIGGLVILSTITFVWCIGFGIDFFNDLGYLIGMIWR